jgi:hypothetical protein
MVEKHRQNVNDGSEPLEPSRRRVRIDENMRKRSTEGLDNPPNGSKIPPNSGEIPLHRSNREVQHPDL